jgi:hypothetical protein
MKEITRAEEIVLLAIWRLKEKAYGVSVQRQIRKDTGKDYTYGTLYGLLRQLAAKGYVHKVMGDPLPKKGGRSRTKEIGIRKVLGASTSGLTFLLSREFTKWVLLANVIAWPVAYWVMSEWLQNFPYRSGIRIGTFVLAGTLAWAIAFLTVSYQAVKASLADPVDSLKYE